MNIIAIEKTKSVKSINPCNSVTQTNFDIVKAHGDALKVATTVSESSIFIFQLPYIN